MCVVDLPRGWPRVCLRGCLGVQQVDEPSPWFVTKDVVIKWLTLGGQAGACRSGGQAGRERGRIGLLARRLRGCGTSARFWWTEKDDKRDLRTQSRFEIQR